MAAQELVCMINGKRLGVITQTETGQIELSYDADYLKNRNATPLSTSMPLSAGKYGSRSVRPFLLGLLPDHQEVLEGWGARFDVSPNNPFALLRHVGEDCAGAVQFIAPERLGASRRSGVAWLEERDIEERLRSIKLDPSTALWEGENDAQGQFSLAGAQSKIALYQSPEGRWGHPFGDNPTSHILKVASQRFPDQDLVENITMQAALDAGLNAATTQVMSFGAERALVVERYDRQFDGDAFRRIHQEDVCQALGLGPDKKYERRGGPGAVAIVELFRGRLSTSAAELAVDRFTEALVFNWLIGCTDAHAKNYSILLAGTNAVLAPLYDLTTGLPYTDQLLGSDHDGRRLSRTSRQRGLVMAMSIGGEAPFGRVGLDNWQTFATNAKVDLDRILADIHRLGEALPDAFADATARTRQEFKSPVVEEALDLVTTNLGASLERIDAEKSTTAQSG
jgi:serine/threonine-protein kinase HipA